MPIKDDDKPEVIKTSIQELKSLYQRIDTNWINLKNRTLGLLAGEVAVVSFIFTDNTFVPKEIYGRVYFAVGIGLVSLAFALLLFILATSSWRMPYDVETSQKLYKRFDSHLDFLEHIREDYEQCINFCLVKMAFRARLYNISLLALSSGIIMLLVLRFR